VQNRLGAAPLHYVRGLRFLEAAEWEVGLFKHGGHMGQQFMAISMGTYSKMIIQTSRWTLGISLDKANGTVCHDMS